MRTTIELPDELHSQVQAIARDTHRTLSETIAELVRRGLGHSNAPEITRSRRTGLPVVTLGRTVTSEDVRSLDDEP